MGAGADPTCPQCGERVLDTGEYSVGHQERATCAHCHAELVRHRGLDGNAWRVETLTPPPDEELGAGD
jgi:hypothetical protein